MRADVEQGSYVLDLDFFAEMVEVGNVSTLLPALHKECFSLFTWCLGPKAREHVGPGKAN